MNSSIGGLSQDGKAEVVLVLLAHGANPNNANQVHYHLPYGQITWSVFAPIQAELYLMIFLRIKKLRFVILQSLLLLSLYIYLIARSARGTFTLVDWKV